MIKNERQYHITRAQAEKFERTLAQLAEHSAEGTPMHPLLLKAQQDALRSQLADRAKLRWFGYLLGGRCQLPRAGY